MSCHELAREGNVAVRRLGPADLAAYRSIRLQALTDTPTAFASSLAREQAFGDDQWLARLTGTGTIVIAETAAGEAVGLAGGVPWPDDASVPELVSMWVAPSYRGSATAATLIDAVVDWATTEYQSDRLVLWVAVGNERALGAYRKSGFELTGARQPMPHDSAVEEVQMVRSLGP